MRGRSSVYLFAAAPQCHGTPCPRGGSLVVSTASGFAQTLEPTYVRLACGADSRPDTHLLAFAQYPHAVRNFQPRRLRKQSDRRFLHRLSP